MAITLLDLYNTTVSQEWAMYDNDALSDAEFEDSLVLALNKSILEIYASYEFPFRERTHLILTIPKMDSYDLPHGLIKRDSNENYIVKYNSVRLKYINDSSSLIKKIGTPDSFYLQNDKIVLYPVPQEKGIVTIDYMTLVVGETKDGVEILTL